MILHRSPSFSRFLNDFAQVCNIFRVPFEVIKQRSQANAHLRPMEILRNTLRTEVRVGMEWNAGMASSSSPLPQYFSLLAITTKYSPVMRFCLGCFWSHPPPDLLHKGKKITFFLSLLVVNFLLWWGKCCSTYLHCMLLSFLLHSMNLSSCCSPTHSPTTHSPSNMSTHSCWLYR